MRAMRSGDGVGGHGSRRLGSRGGEDEPLKLGPDGKPLPKRPTSERLRELWPDIWALVKPRRGILLLGLLLMAINPVSGLVLP